LSYNLYISTVFRSVSWLMKIMRAAHFLKHYVCKEKSWQRELHFLWHPFNFHILFKFGEENGGNPLNTNASCERGSASYDLTMLHIITTWVYDKRYTNIS